MRIYSLSPSNLGNVLGAVDPVAVVDRNLGLINARFGLAIAPTTAADSSTVGATLQAAFDGIAAAAGLTLWPVAPSRNPEAACQANFELINAVW
jgi:hypothetical protein